VFAVDNDVDIYASHKNFIYGAKFDVSSAGAVSKVNVINVSKVFGLKKWGKFWLSLRSGKFVSFARKLEFLTKSMFSHKMRSGTLKCGYFWTMVWIRSEMFWC
jgi:hypothetical protein